MMNMHNNDEHTKIDANCQNYEYDGNAETDANHECDENDDNDKQQTIYTNNETDANMKTMTMPNITTIMKI